MARYYDPDTVGGANDGTSWANAWTNLQTAHDNTTYAVSPLYIRKSGGGSITITQTINITKAGTGMGTRLRWVGCSPAGAEDGTQVVFDGNNGAYNIFTPTSAGYRTFEHLAFTNMGAGKCAWYMYQTNYSVFINCDFSQGASASYAIWAGGYYNLFVECRFRDFTLNSSPYYAFSSPSSTVFVRCEWLHCNHGVNPTSDDCAFIDCVFHQCGTWGIVGFSAAVAVRCVFDSCGLAGSGGGFISEYPLAAAINCRFTNNYIGFCAYIYIAHTIGCGYKSNTNNTISWGTGAVLSLGDIALAADGYINAAAHDFRLLESAPGRSVQLGQYIAPVSYGPAGLGIKELNWPRFVSPIVGA